ncbi:MAG: hypothetical protein J6A89_03535 [Clostridia bacterium]|nr:hypothetical protein [Clostridia bacterium]
MKKIIEKLKGKILVITLIFILINIILNYLLYLFNIRFRLWVIALIVVISIIGFIIGMFEQISKIVENKIKAIGLIILALVPLIVLILIFSPFIFITAAFSYKPEHKVTLYGDEYVAVVNSFINVDVDYYNYYGPLLMGTKVKVHGYFGKGGYDPISNPNISNEVEYIFYDNNGKEIKKINEIYIKDKNGEIKKKESYETNYKETIINENDNYILPEDMKTLYEKKFDKTIIKFVKLDDTLNQNILIQINKSTDNGKKYYAITNEPIQVSSEAKYTILNENLMFVSKNNKIMFTNNTTSLYVSNNGGKDFLESKINYKNENVEFITIEKMPYYEKNNLKFKCSVYQINSNKDGYENKEMIFISNDNGLNWNLENN